MTEQRDDLTAVADALERQRKAREQGSVTISAEQAWKDASVLGREVVRLQQRVTLAQAIVDAARNCYSVVDWPEPSLVNAIEAWDEADTPAERDEEG